MKDQISKWDAKIRAGNLNEVRVELRRRSTKNISRDDRLGFAKICRRVQLYAQAVKVLFPVIRGDNAAGDPPLVEEVAEYASSLLRIGSVQEVRSLLTGTPDQEFPEIVLSRAFLEIVEWNHASAVQHLNQYLNFSNLTEYQRQVAEVNLAISYIGCQRFSEALILLQKLVAETKQQSLTHSICLCYLADTYMEMDDLKASQATLLRAREAVPQADFQHHLLIDKLSAILNSRNGLPTARPEVFDEIKTRARDLEVYEILRGCDFAKAQLYGDQNSFLSCYAGTVYPAFRSRCEALPFIRPNEIEFKKMDLGDIICTQDTTTTSFDLNDPSCLDAGRGIHRSLVAMNLDFYRPLSIGGFHECLYPNTYFDPFSSPNRLHKIILRLRRWVASEGLSWVITFDKRGLLFSTGSGEPLRMSTLKGNLLNSQEMLLQKLFNTFGHSTFRTEDLVEKGLCSSSQAYRCISAGVSSGQVHKSGRGRYTVYSFKQAPFQAA